MSVQENIYKYFELNPKLIVLFVFNPMVKAELNDAVWKRAIRL